MLAVQYNLCLALERADWDAVDTLAVDTGIKVDDIFAMHYEALEWADNMKGTLE
jgi:hypothetical protein